MSLRQGVSPSTLVLLAMASATKLAAKAFWAAWVRRANQRPTSPAIMAARSGAGADRALALAKARRKDAVSVLKRPPGLNARTTKRHRPPRVSSG